MTELEVARAIATGEAPSPTVFGSFQLWAIRITGTGVATRPAMNETVFRSPNVWLNDETLARLNGLVVLVDHPERSSLNSEEFSDRAVGSVLLPYIASEDGFRNDTDPDDLGPEIWAVVRIYDDPTNQMLSEREVSTSPAVVFRPSDGNETYQMGDGSHVLVEKSPSLIDHISLVENGVWDRGNGPSGIRNDLLIEKDKPMSDEPNAEQPTEAATEEPKADAEFPGQMLDKMLTTLDSIGKICDGLGKRMDAMEKRADAAPGTPRQVAADSEPKGFLERQEAERKDAAEKASVQSRADGVYMSLGQQSPAPMAGEKLQAYRARLARGLQRHSPGFKGVDLTTLPSGIAFDSVENRIYADAFEASKTPEVIPGVLREIVKVDVGGRRVSTFHGDHTFISHLSRPSRRVVGINTKGRE